MSISPFEMNVNVSIKMNFDFPCHFPCRFPLAPKLTTFIPMNCMCLSIHFEHPLNNLSLYIYFRIQFMAGAYLVRMPILQLTRHRRTNVFCVVHERRKRNCHTKATRYLFVKEKTVWCLCAQNNKIMLLCKHAAHNYVLHKQYSINEPQHQRH